jgi:excinuclease UvrABC ATPase subunit
VAGQTGIYGAIEVRGARENNLRDVSLDIPKRQLTVVTGVSGSGKSSLVFDTVAAESQRLINETYSAFVQSFLPHYGRPDVDSVDNLSAAIVVDQARMGSNARSTVGTATDASSLLRILYSRLGEPAVHPASALGFNDPKGMCPECEGLGRASSIDVDALLDRDRSLDEDPIRFPGHAASPGPGRSSPTPGSSTRAGSCATTPTTSGSGSCTARRSSSGTGR